jgi:outer membrane protein assembly factor BamB
VTIRIAVLVALAGLATACGGAQPESAARPDIVAQSHKPRACTPTRVRVAVMDGDTHRPVRGAVVRVAHRVVRSDRKGFAWHRLRCRRSVPVRITARGYLTKLARPPFKRRAKVVVRIYRRSLQWTIYGAGPERTQAQTHIRVRPPFRIAWSRPLGALIEFPAVVSEAIAYIGNFRGTVRALSTRNGKVAWRRDLHEKMAASLAIVGDELVVHTMHGHVWVLRRSNGKVLWSFRIGSPIESSPVVRYGLDYFGTHSGRIYALDLVRRRVRWSRGGNCKITSSVAITGRTMFLGDYCGRVLALSTRNGRTRWTRGVNGKVYGTPAVLGGRLFVPSSTGGSLTAFRTTGRYLWRVRTGSYVYSSPAAWAGRVFFGSYNGRLYAVSASSGRALWSVRAGGPVSGAAVVVDGVAYAGATRGGGIVGADAKTGRVLLRFPDGAYVPVSGNGRRLLLHGFSRLYAVDHKHPKRRRKR